MTEQELRALVREAIATLGPGATAPHSGTRTPVRPSTVPFALFTLPTGADSDGPCIIEPAVTCNHCGYCKSYGH